MRYIFFESVTLVLLLEACLTGQVARGQGSILYDYIDLSEGGLSIQLAQINPNGSGDEAFNVPLRNPAYPVWSRDGQSLAVAGTDPSRPFKWSTDIFVFRPAGGQLAKLSAFEDFAGASGFATFYPSYLAFSADGQRVAAGMVSYVGARATIVNTNALGQADGPYDTTSKISRCVSLFVFKSDGSAPFQVVSPLCDDDNAHPGEGVDWSPAQDLLAYPYNTATVFSGAGGQFPITAIHLIDPTPDAADQGRHRQLTFPTGSSGGPFDQYSLYWNDDFAPAFSPDGKQVAYVRSITAVTSFGVKEPSLPAIRVVQTGGSGDHEVAKFKQGDYVTRLSWSADGTQLVFDLGRQALRNGFPLRTFDPNSVTIALINLDGSGFRQIRGAPATWPVWRPGMANQAAPPPLTVRLVRATTPFVQLVWPTPAQNPALEATSQLGPTASWKPVTIQATSGAGQSSLSLPLDAPARFFRFKEP